MKIITWTLTIFIVFSFVACKNSTDANNTNKTTTEMTTKTTTPVVEKTPVETSITKEVAESVSDKKETVVEAKTKTTKAKLAKPEKKEIPKPKQVVEKVKETPKKVAETTKVTTEKVVEKAKEEVKTITTPVVEAPTKVVEKVQEVVATPPPAPKPIAKPEAPKVIETPKAEKPVVKVETPPTPVAKPALSHDIWDGLLRRHVSASGAVNYGGFKSDKAELQSYLDLLAANPPQSDWGRGKTMAYWINAYNAFTIKLIVDNYPVGSITDLEGGKPWGKRWIKLGSQTYSLDQIEKEILLKKYKDARVHFAVNCAAKSCPAILNSAWTATNLEGNFERQTKSFINNSQFNDISAKSARVSQLFNWYASDFGDVKTFINKYSNTKLKPNARIDFMEYNWKLNE